MKNIIFVILLCVNVFGFQMVFGEEVVKEAYKIKIEIQDSQETCRSSYTVAQNLIDEAQKGQLSESMELEKYYICLGKKMNFLSSEGELNIVKLQDWLKKSLEHDPETVDKATETCKNNDGEKSDKEVFQFIICLAGKGVPVDVVGAHYIEKVREEISDNHFSCKKQSGINQSILSKARKGIFLNTKALQNQYLCFGLYARYLDLYYAGFKFDILRDWLKNFLKYESTVVDKALDKCYKPEKHASLLESNFQIVKCLNEEGVSVDNLKEDKQNVQVETEIEATISDAEDICAETANIETYLINKAREGNFSDSNKLKMFYFCFSTRIGYLSVNGDFKLEDWLKKSLKYEENIVDKAVEKCRSDETDLIEQNYQVVKCLNKEGVSVDVPHPI